MDRTEETSETQFSENWQREEMRAWVYIRSTKTLIYFLLENKLKNLKSSLV